LEALLQREVFAVVPASSVVAVLRGMHLVVIAEVVARMFEEVKHWES
jgi:hypothetical protein